MPDEKSPVDQVLDLFVFAPVGLALTAKTQLPEIVAKGRAQVEGQLTLARFLGQFAVTKGKSEVEKRVKAYTSPAPSSPSSAGTAPPSAPQAAPAAPSAPATPAPVPVDEQGDPSSSTPASADLAIPGYDALSASQVVQRLAGLSSGELEQVRLYEASTRGRKTVLTKISQLQ